MIGILLPDGRGETYLFVRPVGLSKYTQSVLFLGTLLPFAAPSFDTAFRLFYYGGNVNTGDFVWIFVSALGR